LLPQSTPQSDIFNRERKPKDDLFLSKIERFVSGHTPCPGQDSIIFSMKRQIILILLLFLLLLAACGGQEVAEPPPTATENAAPLPTETSEPELEGPTDGPISVPVEEKEMVQTGETAERAADSDPTATIEATIEVESPTEPLVVSGQTADGAYFYGNPDAPVILFDYSDFL
jgi:hypothetical protein